MAMTLNREAAVVGRLYGGCSADELVRLAGKRWHRLRDEALGVERGDGVKCGQRGVSVDEVGSSLGAFHGEGCPVVRHGSLLSGVERS